MDVGISFTKGPEGYVAHAESFACNSGREHARLVVMLCHLHSIISPRKFGASEVSGLVLRLVILFFAVLMVFSGTCNNLNDFGCVN